jgi:hypothetical protein
MRVESFFREIRVGALLLVRSQQFVMLTATPYIATKHHPIALDAKSVAFRSINVGTFRIAPWALLQKLIHFRPPFGLVSA